VTSASPAAVAPSGRRAADHMAEPFKDRRQQRAAVSLGMWIFLTTETLFFGVLFYAYTIARLQAPDAFAEASRHTNLVLGTANTAILLTSSLFMALAVRNATLGARKGTVAFLLATAALGLVFTGIKLAEYALDYREQLVPLANFAFDPRYARGALVFFGLYFVTTGLHLVHLGIGIALVAFLAWHVLRSSARDAARPIETTGLYWHFVDIVWIFLYPCLYLVARS
jgi:cytochrome c oxidase subunit 3